MRSVAGPHLVRVVFVLAMVFASLASFVRVFPAQAAEFTIADGDVAGLIAAINTANSNGVADTIHLATGGTYTLTASAGVYFGAIGLPLIFSEIAINGNGATITRSSADGTPEFRILAVTEGGNLTLDRVTISNGRGAVGGGGGIYVNSGTLRLTNSTVTNNYAPSGGGINGNLGSTLFVINSTITGNEAGASGGGIFSIASATVINSTISGNSAGSSGGGGLLLDNVDPLSLTNTIVAGNTATGADQGVDITGLVSGTNNLIGDGTGMSGLTYGVEGNMVGTAEAPIAPLLGSLANNGGLTQTMALLSGSPAIDAGTSTDETPAIDQRGVFRPQGSANDIGAFEVGELTPPVITPTVTGTLGDNSWYISDISVSWSVTDPVAQILSSSGCESTTITTDTTGQTLTCIATSAGGTTSVPVTIKRDATAPVVTYVGNLGTYGLTDTIAITCTATDATSGIATNTCTDISGDATTFGQGSHTFSATATDNAGNLGTGTTSFVIGLSYAQLCTLTKDVARHPILANAACASLILAQRADQANNAQVERLALTLYRFQIRLAMAFRAISASDGQNLLDWSYLID